MIIEIKVVGMRAVGSDTRRGTASTCWLRREKADKRGGPPSLPCQGVRPKDSAQCQVMSPPAENFSSMETVVGGPVFRVVE